MFRDPPSDNYFFPPIRMVLPPQTAQVPFTALRPFFRVTSSGLFTSCCFLHLKQYAFISPSCGVIGKKPPSPSATIIPQLTYERNTSVLRFTTQPL